MDGFFLDTIVKSTSKYGSRRAFCIKDTYYTYSNLSEKIAGISEELRKQNFKAGTPVGVVTTDCIETYASVLALWLNNFVFVPISPTNSSSRNQSVIEQMEIPTILSPTVGEADILELGEIDILETHFLSSSTSIKNYNKDLDNVLYVLFTSGSTGVPKGVKINYKNLNAFIFSFVAIGYDFNESDTFLQLYDLSFDASIHCYVLPLLFGACVYTVPPDEVKFLYAYKLMKEKGLSFAKMPPSTINYLRPHFSKINLPKLRYMLFGGEALPVSMVKDWQKCIPNAQIYNVYGPTEATINCFYREVGRESSFIKESNGIVAIGKPIGDTVALTVNEGLKVLPAKEKGELVVAGKQISEGYFNNIKKDKEAYVELHYDGEKRRFYKTGDLVYYDEEGDYYYCGRIDSQVQIQGYRVELGELENCAREFIPNINAVAMAKKSEQGIDLLYLFIENREDLVEPLRDHLKKRLPAYMVPSKVISISSFPLSVSGKVDRVKFNVLV